MIKCFTCNKDTKNKKFCSIKCSAISNGKNRMTKTCKECNTLIQCNRIYCKSCNSSVVFNYKKDTTVDELITRYSDVSLSQSKSLIRVRARKIAKALGWTCCKICGYNKHYEVCHIKPVSSFPNDAKISEINEITNLLPLCPNCHWEFDNGLLDI